MFNVQTKRKMFYPKSQRCARWRAIRETMRHWRSVRPEPTAYNYSLKGYIKVDNRVSSRETPYWGSLTKESTALIVNHFNEILRFAVKKEEVDPHSNVGGRFSSLIILERHIEGVGTAKLTVGARPDGTLVQYCITAVPSAC